MCTVTFIPKGKGDFFLTSNRDEAPHRAARGIQRRDGLLYPQDSGAGGTWIAASGRDKAAVLLNGAFDLHERMPPYRLSRGLMVLQYFDFAGAEQFISGFEFQGMEPFTLILWDQGALHELRWNDRRLHHKKLDPAKPHIWASATLYSAEYQEKRRQWFRDWLSPNHAPGQEDILHWHRTAGEGDPWNDVVMNRNNVVRTVSITGIAFTGEEILMRFEDLLDGHQQAETTKILIREGAKRVL